ncbi:MAG: IPT/TIG domain-containing protein [Dysgonamonadaceae bacterium]|jgi:hypothetical protein|nr:IPT/TIG domain-containing protein [Dysgonamonadaceae bacterium]
MFALCFESCKESKDDSAEAETFDPSKPVVVSDFTPKEGGTGQRLVIYGSNFGSDPDIIQVFIGGKEAKVIGVNGQAIYVLVPEKAYKGNIEVRIGDPGSQAVASADGLFDFKRKMTVSTVIGYKNDRGDEPWVDGKFKDDNQLNMASGFKESSWLRFDPVNPKHLWMVFDNVNGLYLINFEDSTVTKKRSDFARPRSIDFTLDGEYMIVAEDRGGENDRNTIRMSRASGFQNLEEITRYKQCNTATIHPINGELYFNSYSKGEFFRFDINKYFNDGGTVVGVTDNSRWPQYGKLLFTILDPSWEYRIIIHPTGSYAYIVVVNRHYILRTDYNWTTREFNPPYIFSGTTSSSGYLDGVGTSTKMDTPYQGVFVKNPDYVAEGKSDEYDFYFTDLYNHCIRKLTPEGLLSTYAGRGSSSLNSNPYGYVDGDLREEARFDRPSGIAYNEAEGAFYIGDRENHRIRKIALEEIEE